MFYILLLTYVLSTSGGLVALKLGSASGALVELVDGRIVFHLNFVSLLGVFLYAMSFILYIYLIAKNDLGYIIPLTTALVYILIFFASFIIFKENFTIQKILAIILIIAGLILLNIKR